MDVPAGDARALLVVPVGLLLAYGALRFGNSLFNELRELVANGLVDGGSDILMEMYEAAGFDAAITDRPEEMPGVEIIRLDQIPALKVKILILYIALLKIILLLDDMSQSFLVY